MLNSAQCELAFPGLFEEIERPKRSRRRRKITQDEIDAIQPRNGYVRAMIYDQQVGPHVALYTLKIANETSTPSFT